MSFVGTAASLPERATDSRDNDAYTEGLGDVILEKTEGIESPLKIVYIKIPVQPSGCGFPQLTEAYCTWRSVRMREMARKALKPVSWTSAMGKY